MKLSAQQRFFIGYCKWEISKWVDKYLRNINHEKKIDKIERECLTVHRDPLMEERQVDKEQQQTKKAYYITQRAIPSGIMPPRLAKPMANMRLAAKHVAEHRRSEREDKSTPRAYKFEPIDVVIDFTTTKRRN